MFAKTGEGRKITLPESVFFRYARAKGIAALRGVALRPIYLLAADYRKSTKTGAGVSAKSPLANPFKGQANALDVGSLIFNKKEDG